MLDLLIGLSAPAELSGTLIEKVTSGEDIRLINLDIVRKNYHELKKAFPYAVSYTAVKANSAEGILELLNEEGASFEIATIEELRKSIKRGISPERIIFSHPAKDAIEIAESFKIGVNRFASDSQEDIALIAKHAPGSKVMVRIKTSHEDKNHNSLTGFNERFGVTPAAATNLLRSLKSLGLEPYGVSFHVGTQEEDVNAWDWAIMRAASIFKELKNEGTELEVLDIGGGFPSRYKSKIPALSEYGEAIHRSINKHFSGALPQKIIIEPGRAISAMAGITFGRVINVKPCEHDDSRYIVTLSTGKFSAGLFNVGNGMFFYRKTSSGKMKNLSGASSKKADIHGKGGASFDRPIEGDDICMPGDLKSGDIVIFTGTGAYSGEMTTNWCAKSPPRTITLSNNAEMEPLLHNTLSAESPTDETAPSPALA